MKKILLIGIFFSKNLLPLSEAEDPDLKNKVCAIEEKAFRQLNLDDTKALKRDRFLWKGRLFISPEYVADCELRHYAAKYITAKIGNADARLRGQFPAKYKCEISDIALAALGYKGWDGGQHHEKYNVASEDLMPCWRNRSIAFMQSKHLISLELFTKTMFEEPPEQIMDMAENELKSRQLNLIEAGQLLFLLKNGGKLPKTLYLTRYSTDGLIAPAAQARNRINELLKKKTKISLKESWDFAGNYGEL